MSTPIEPAPHLLDAAGAVDLARISTPPPELHLDNLRRRGLDVVVVRWTAPPRVIGLRRWFGLSASRKKAGAATTLTFVERRITIETVGERGSAEPAISIAMSDVGAVTILRADKRLHQRLAISHKGATSQIGEGLSGPALEWLRDRVVLESAGLAWKPLFNVGKRSTRATSHPDTEPYRRWSSQKGKLISLYLGEAVLKIAELEEALAGENYRKARGIAHWLKSSSASVGAMQLSDLCQRLEIELEGADRARILSLAPHLFAEFGKVSAALRDEQTNERNVGPHDAAEGERDDRLAGVSVLLVDDSRVNQELAGDCLGGCGAVVTLADDGQQAFDKNTAAEFCIILMDCQMDGVDGFAATRMIRDMEMRIGRAPTPIIALTANALRDDRNLCLAAGMDDYLSKPFIDADLIDVVAKWAEKVAMRREMEAAGMAIDAAGMTMNAA